MLNEKMGGMKQNANAKAAHVATIAADQKSPYVTWKITHRRKRIPAVVGPKPAQSPIAVTKLMARIPAKLPRIPPAKRRIPVLTCLPFVELHLGIACAFCLISVHCRFVGILQSPNEHIP